MNEHIPGVRMQDKGYTKAMHATRRKDRLHDSHDHSNHGGSRKKAA